MTEPCPLVEGRCRRRNFGFGRPRVVRGILRLALPGEQRWRPRNSVSRDIVVIFHLDESRLWGVML